MNILQYNDVEILRKELVVLKHVTFSLEEGEFAYLMGRVGSGKSSLMKSIYAEIPVSTGQAEVMGTSLVGIRRKQIPLLRRNIGIVFQDFQLLTDRSVYDNLRFVLDATGWRDRVEIDDRIDQVLHQVGMQNKSYMTRCSTRWACRTRATRCLMNSRVASSSALLSRVPCSTVPS